MYRSLVAVGTKKGNLWLLKAESLEPARSIPFAYSRCIQYTCTQSVTGFTIHLYRGSIRAIEFSECGEFLATVDTDRCVSVFRSVQSRNIKIRNKSGTLYLIFLISGSDRTRCWPPGSCWAVTEATLAPSSRSCSAATPRQATGVHLYSS